MSQSALLATELDWHNFVDNDSVYENSDLKLSRRATFNMAVASEIKGGLDTAIEWAKKANEYGAGELLLTSMDMDGTKSGYDLDLNKEISISVEVPVIASGGAGSLEDLHDGLTLGKADAVLAASIFHFGKYSIKEAKEYLSSKSVAMRI